MVEAPDGRRWVVRRRWAPRLGSETLWARFRRRSRGTARRGGRLSDGLDVADGCIDLELLLLAVAVITVLVLAIFVVIPVLVAVVDLLVLIVLGILGVVGRVLFRRPWTIEARADDGTCRTWKKVGWRASREHRDEIAQLLAAGITPPG